MPHPNLQFKACFWSWWSKMIKFPISFHHHDQNPLGNLHGFCSWWWKVIGIPISLDHHDQDPLGTSKGFVCHDQNPQEFLGVLALSFVLPAYCIMRNVVYSKKSVNVQRVDKSAHASTAQLWMRAAMIPWRICRNTTVHGPRLAIRASLGKICLGRWMWKS